MVEEILAAVRQPVVTVAGLLVTGYVFPWLGARVGLERLELLTLIAHEAHASVEARAPQIGPSAKTAALTAPSATTTPPNTPPPPHGGHPIHSMHRVAIAP